MTTLCSCGHAAGPGASRARARWFCDAEFRVKCELCTSELLDAAVGGVCRRCARVQPAPRAAADGCCPDCYACPLCASALDAARVSPGASSYQLTCGACGWGSGACGLTAASPSLLRDAAHAAVQAAAPSGVVAQLASLLAQSEVGAPWARAAAGEPRAAAGGRRALTAPSPRGAAAAAAAARPSTASLGAHRAAVEAQLRAGMAALLIAGDGDCAPPPLAPSLAARQAGERAAAHSALATARDALQGAAAGASTDAPRRLPVPLRLLPLATRRCLACRSHGKPGLLDVVGGHARSAGASAAAVGRALWYKRRSAAACIVPRVEAVAAAGARDRSGSSEGGSGRGAPSTTATPNATTTLRVHNPHDTPIVVALVVAAQPGAACALSAATFAGPDGAALAPVALPPGVDIRPFQQLLGVQPPATGGGHAASSTAGLACIVLRIPAGSAHAAVDSDVASDGGDGGAGGDASSSGGGGDVRSPLWSVPPVPAAGCAQGDGFVELAVTWVTAREPLLDGSAGGAEAASSHARQRLLLGVATALPPATLLARTGAASLPPAAAAARCTLVTVVAL